MTINAMTKVKKILTLYIKYFIKSAKIHMYYNDFFPVLLGALARDSVAVVAIYFITFRFYDIGGWDMGELLFLYSLLYISYGFGMMFFAGVRDVENNIENGTFDRYMVTPLSVFFQAITARVDLLATASYCLLGIVLFRYSCEVVGMIWDIRNIIMLVTALIGGMLIQSSLLFLGGMLSFWTIKTGNIKFLLFFNTRSFSIYPINIYPKGIQFILMFVFPFAFVNYFPARYMLEKDEGAVISQIYAYGSIIVGIIIFVLALFIWNRGIKNYKSTGN